MAGLLTGLALKPAPKDPEPKRAAPAAEAPVVEAARSGPTPWWVAGSDALFGRAEPRVTLAQADAPAEAPAPLEVYPAALDVPPAAPAQRYARAEPAPRYAQMEPTPRYARAEPPPRPAGGEWREDTEGVYFVPEDEAYPREPDYDYDPYA